MISFRLAFVLLFLFSVSSTSEDIITEKEQIQGCSVENLSLEPCMDVINKNDKVLVTSGFCCTVLNQAVEAGFRCLCSLLEPYYSPPLNTPLLLQLSNCFISTPPLSWCQALVPPEGRPLPVLSPPPPGQSTEQLPQPSAQETLPDLPPPSPPLPEVLAPMSSASSTNATVISSMSRGDFLISNANKIQDLLPAAAFLALIINSMILIPASNFISPI